MVVVFPMPVLPTASVKSWSSRVLVATFCKRENCRKEVQISSFASISCAFHCDQAPSRLPLLQVFRDGAKSHTFKSAYQKCSAPLPQSAKKERFTSKTDRLSARFGGNCHFCARFHYPQRRHCIGKDNPSAEKAGACEPSYGVRRLAP